MMLSPPYDALVAGGGPAGSVVGALLACAGRSVMIIERNRDAQHKICGEFLSPECLPLLRRIGVDPVALGAQTIRRLRIVARDVLADVELPAPALSLTRRTLDEALLECAKKSGASVLRGYSVEQLVRAQETWNAQASGSAAAFLNVRGRDAFIATGKHEMRGWARNTQGTQDNFVAFKMYFALSLRSNAELAEHIELIFFPGGYAGLQVVEAGAANLCMLITQEKFHLLGSRWEAVLGHLKQHSPVLADRLIGAHPLLHRPLALSRIPYGYCVPATSEIRLPWRLGDQAAVIPSFVGDGMSIAMRTAHRAASLFLNGGSARDLHTEIRTSFRRKLAASTWLSRILVALPSIARVAQLRPAVLEEIFVATRLSLAEDSNVGE